MKKDMTSDTYNKMADTFKKKGDRHYAQAKLGDGDFHFGLAKNAYNTSKKIKEKVDKDK